MRTLLLILLIFSGSAFAQEKPSFFEYLKSLGKTDCQAFLDNGDALINASNKAYNGNNWDEAFLYDNEAFHTYMRAFGHCDDEPENLQKSRERLDAALVHGKQLACLYHITEAQAAYQRSTLALEHLKSASISLKHAEESRTILDTDAEKFCSFDEGRRDTVNQLKDLVSQTIIALEDHIKEHGDDSIQVP
jgi:hypothetical protein